MKKRVCLLIVFLLMFSLVYSLSFRSNSKAKVKKVKNVQQIIYSISENKSKAKNFIYKGAFEIREEDFQKLSGFLKAVETNILVTLDFSECYMTSKNKSKSVYLDYAFNNVDSLYEIYFPEGVTHFGSNVFSNCKKLRAVYFPKKTIVHSIGWRAFEDNPALEEVHLYNFDGELGECFRCEEGGN